MGVFPEGLNLIKIAGFSEPAKTKSNDPVSFAARHELAHLFHVVALRAILSENSAELSALTTEHRAAFVAELESGLNYLEFEKIVTDISGLLHVVSPVQASNRRYGEKLNVLLWGLKSALFAGKVRFTTGWSAIETYAKFVSKVPILLGQSLPALALRMPFILFITSYVANDSFHLWVNQFLL